MIHLQELRPPTSLQMVREVQAGQVSPLPRVPDLRLEDGSSLPMDLQLRRLPELQVLLPSALLHRLRFALHHLEEFLRVATCVVLRRLELLEQKADAAVILIEEAEANAFAHQSIASHCALILGLAKDWLSKGLTTASGWDL